MQTEYGMINLHQMNNGQDLKCGIIYANIITTMSVTKIQDSCCIIVNNMSCTKLKNNALIKINHAVLILISRNVAAIW